MCTSRFGAGGMNRFARRPARPCRDRTRMPFCDAGQRAAGYRIAMSVTELAAYVRVYRARLIVKTGVATIWLGRAAE